MSYNSENYYALRREFEEKHLRAIERAETLKKTLWGKIDGLREIDEALSDTGARIMGAALGGKHLVLEQDRQIAHVVFAGARAL